MHAASTVTRWTRLRPSRGPARLRVALRDARDRLIVAALKAGLERRDVSPSIAFFKGARVADDGSLELDPAPPARPTRTRSTRRSVEATTSSRNGPSSTTSPGSGMWPAISLTRPPTVVAS